MRSSNRYSGGRRYLIFDIEWLEFRRKGDFIQALIREIENKTNLKVET